MRGTTKMVLALSVLITSCIVCRPAAAQPTSEQPDTGVGRFVDQQTVAVLRIRPSRLDMQATSQFLQESMPAVHEQLTWIGLSTQWSQWVDHLSDAGVDDAHVVVSLADRFDQIAFLIVSHEVDADVREKLRQSITHDMSWEAYDDEWILAWPTTHRRLQRRESKPVHDQFETIHALTHDADLALMILTNEDQRRAVMAMMPTLPSHLGGESTSVVMEGFRWGAVMLTSPPQAKVEAIVESADAESARELLAWYEGLLDRVGRDAGVLEIFPRFDALKPWLLPAIVESRLELTVDQSDDGFADLAMLLSEPIAKVANETRRRTAAQHIKDLCIAMHNYTDVHDVFPSFASYDASGEPLLSWRVHLLPFIDAELYDQFHLDEPWDSDHNRQLISQMPEIFLPAASGLSPSEGKSTVRAPAGDGAMFERQTGVSFRDVRDGLSNTIMLVEVPDDQAVIWTKPDRFDPDLSTLGTRFDHRFLAGLGDASVLALQTSIDAETFRALLTIDGSESIDTDRFRSND